MRAKKIDNIKNRCAIHGYERLRIDNDEEFGRSLHRQLALKDLQKEREDTRTHTHIYL